jgi:outer membrane protein assembly factor BamB
MAAARRRSSRGPTSASSSTRRSERKREHATIYVLDAETGKELWSSGEQMHQWNHFSGITVANGHVYLATYDGTLYCFGLK